MLQLKMILNKLKLQHSTAYYLLFTFAEVLLIVVGILLALQFDNWDKEQDYRELELQYYQDLSVQLQEDKQVLLGQIQYSNNFKKQFRQIINIVSTNDRTRQRELVGYVFNLKNYSDFRRKSTIFQTLISTGDIKHIKDKNLIAGLQNLEGEYNYIERIEETHSYVILESLVPLFLMKAIRVSDLSLVDAEVLYNYQFENIVFMVIGLMEEKTGIYQRSIEQIDAILSLIDKKLSKLQIVE